MICHLSRCSLILGTLLLSAVNTGCATLFENPAAEMSNSIAVQNPAKTGKVDMQPVESQGGTARMDSFDKASKTLCFAMDTEMVLSNGGGVETEVRAYAEPTKNLNSVKATKPSSIVKKASRQELYTYQDKETTTFRDANGQTYATAETPVTRTGSKEIATYSICFKNASFLSMKSRYVVLLHRFPTMFGPRNVRETWQLEE